MFGQSPLVEYYQQQAQAAAQAAAQANRAAQQAQQAMIQAQQQSYMAPSLSMPQQQVQAQPMQAQMPLQNTQAQPSAQPMQAQPSAQPSLQFAPPTFIVNTVTDIAEAKGFMVDPRSIYLFVDTASGKIYYKRMNNDGRSDFYTYCIQEKEQTGKKQVDPLQKIDKRLSHIEEYINSLWSIKGKLPPKDYIPEQQAQGRLSDKEINDLLDKADNFNKNSGEAEEGK